MGYALSKFEIKTHKLQSLEQDFERRVKRNGSVWKIRGEATNQRSTGDGGQLESQMPPGTAETLTDRAAWSGMCATLVCEWT